MKMLVSPGLAMLFLLRSSPAEECPENCRCNISARSAAINCSFRDLREIPLIPEMTTELYLHNNLLTTVAPGTFRSLSNLQMISLHNNFWNCDCHIAYLSQWLQNPPARVQFNVTCFTPTSIRRKPVAELRGNEYSRCQPLNRYRCHNLCTGSIVLCLLCLFLIILMMYCLNSIKSNPYIFTPGNYFKKIEYISSKKKRQNNERWFLMEFEMSEEDDVESHESVEILPQIITILNTTFKNKIKEH